MHITPSLPLAALGGYAFDELDKQVATLRNDGIFVVDFGVGDPTCPTPQVVRDAVREGLDRFACSGYPSYIGNQEFRTAISDWTARRFGVRLDADREVTVNLGSKESVFHFPMAILQPGDIVLAPSPGYPPYRTGTRFAGGEVHSYPLDETNGFLPRFDALPKDVLKRARILWVNYPNSPTGLVPGDDFYRETVDFCRQNEIILASDEAYTELYFGTRPPRSFLEFGRAGIIVFQSLSKRSAMTGYRVGWVCGDEQLVTLVKKLKTNIDSGSPNFIQAAGIAALQDEEHVAISRRDYAEKQTVLVDGLRRAGLTANPSEATIYLWQKAPEGMSDVEYARRLLDPDIACAVMPGSWLATPLEDGRNPGEGYVRWALCPDVADIRLAADRLAASTW
jgi:LL-diaminopimelate aminotransferase